MLLLTAEVVRVYQQAAAARAPNQLRLLLLSAVVVLWMLAVPAFQHQRPSVPSQLKMPRPKHSVLQPGSGIRERHHPKWVAQRHHPKRVAPPQQFRREEESFRQRPEPSKVRDTDGPLKQRPQAAGW